jgi:hypothetical protein
MTGGMNGVIVALVLAVLSAVGYAGAAVAQQRVASRTGGGLRRLLAERGWWLAIGLNGVGAALHVVALRFGPLTLVQPLGALTLVAALPLAAFTSSRTVSAREWRGAATTVLGLAGIFALTSPVGDASRELDVSGILALCAVTGLALLLLVSAARTAGGVAGSLLYATAAGAAYAVSSVLTKTITEAVTDTDALVLLGAAVGGVVAMAMAGLLLSQAAYAHADVAAPTAAITLVNPVVSAAVGLTVLGEKLAAGTLGAALALAFAAIAARGVVTLITTDHDTVPVDAEVEVEVDELDLALMTLNDDPVLSR